MNNQDTHIILDKELRRDIDAIIQRLKTATGFGGQEYFTKGDQSNWRPSKEREQAITKLQEAVMWLGMDLKAINDENPPEPLAVGSFRKKPVVIQAAQFDGTIGSVESLSIPECSQNLGDRTLQIPTLEGVMTAQPGDWIIRGVQGEFYPCKPDIFAATYETEGRVGNPYPNSKDPSNTIIEPTADGLKL